MKTIKKKILALSTITAIALSGCGSGGGSGGGTPTVTGVLADGAIGNASYECGTTTGFTNVDGEFTCPLGSAVDFYYGNIKLGGVDKLPDDKIVLIQDVLDVNRSDVSHPEVTRMAVFLQSLDNDGDHNNGIYLDPKMIETLVTDKKDFTEYDDSQIDNIIDTVISNETDNKNLRKVNKTTAQTNLQKTTDNVKEYGTIDGEGDDTSNLSDDTTAPNKPTSKTDLDITRDNSEEVIVSGEVGAKIFIDGKDTNKTIGEDGTQSITLDTSGANGTKTFDITLQDSNNNTSGSTTVTITKKSPCLTLSSINYNGAILSDTNYLGLGTDYNLTVELSDTITSAGLNISASSDTNATVGTLSTPNDTNVTFSYNAPTSLMGMADYNTSDTLSIVHDGCPAITAKVPLYKKYVAPFTKDELITLISNYTTAYNSDPNSAYTLSLAQDIINADISQITDMSGLFSNLWTFNLDLSKWDTSHVTNMDTMFYNTRAFNQDIGDWNTSNVTDMTMMFEYTTAFNQDLSNWDVSKVIYFNKMFDGATAFNQDLSAWDVSDVAEHPNFSTNWGGGTEPTWYVAPITRAELDTLISDYTTAYDSNPNSAQTLAYAQEIINANTSQITDMSRLFVSKSTFNLDISKWDTSNVTDMSVMFATASTFNQPLDWNTSNVTDMSYMFKGASTFNQPLAFDTSNVTDMSQMFQDATAFNQALNFDTSNVTTMYGMYDGASAFNQPLNFDTFNVNNMKYMFQDAIAFNKPLDWNTSSVTDMSSMFKGATAFNQPLDWNTSSVTTMQDMFKGATAFNQSLNWNTSSVTTMRQMFAEASSLNQPLTFDTSSVTSMSGMFTDATAFNQSLTFSDTSSVTSMYSMFRRATSFNQDLSAWDVSNVTKHTYFSDSWGGGTEPTWP